MPVSRVLSRVRLHLVCLVSSSRSPLVAAWILDGRFAARGFHWRPRIPQLDSVSQVFLFRKEIVQAFGNIHASRGGSAKSVSTISGGRSKQIIPCRNLKILGLPHGRDILYQFSPCERNRWTGRVVQKPRLGRKRQGGDAVLFGGAAETGSS